MQMQMILYFYTEDIDDDALSIHILEIQMVIVKYSHTEDVDDDGLDDDVPMKPLPRVESFLERGISDVAVGLYHPWELALK